MILYCILGLCLGLSWGAYQGSISINNTIDNTIEGKIITATGYVKRLPNINDSSQQFEFVMIHNSINPNINDKTVLLSWFNPTFDLIPAQYYQIEFKLKRPHGSLNPNGFDYEQYLIAKDILATGSINNRTTPIALNQSINIIDMYNLLPYIEYFRYIIRKKLIYINNNNDDAVHWVNALALGDQRSLSDNEWRRYNATGTGHLLAVSGTHITMMGGLIAYLCGWLWALNSNCLLKIPLQTLRFNILVGVSILYALISGWALPAQRTVFMLLGVWISHRFNTRPKSSHTIATAGFIAIGYEPIAIISPSFWLSYGAVIVLLILNQYTTHTNNTLIYKNSNHIYLKYIQHKVYTLKNIVILQLGLTLALFPITGIFFNQLSLISPIGNAIAMPIMGFITTPFALLAAALSLVWNQGAALCIAIVGASQNIVNKGLNTLLNIPYANVYIPSLNSYYNQVNHNPNDWTVVFLDIGQGNSIIVHKNKKVLLFDTGTNYTAHNYNNNKNNDYIDRKNNYNNAGSRIIIPYLQSLGVSTLEHLIISHSDEDHIGGLRSVVSNMGVNHITYSLSPTHDSYQFLNKNSLKSMYTLTRCEQGKQILWEGLTLSFLNPPIEFDYSTEKSNNGSCVVKIEDKTTHRSVLLTGDIEASQELALINTYNNIYNINLNADVLLAPHHGSKTSSTEDFLKAVNPKHVVIQAGYKNRYGHPHPSIMKRYADLNIQPWRNDEQGAIIMTVNNMGDYEIQGWRSLHKRYWHTMP